MKELTLKELQNLSLEILKDVDSFCKKHDIKYSIAYGTLLGAVRHKGFIPWDDDIDILMTRENYERFRNEYSSPDYKYVDYVTDPNCEIAFGRVYDTKRTVTYSRLTWVHDYEPRGVWIDIFPLDRVPDDEKKFLDLYAEMLEIIKNNNKARKNDVLIKKGTPFKFVTKILRRRLFHSKVKTSKEYLAQMDDLIRRAGESGGHHFSQFPGAEEGWEYIPEEWISEYTTLPFEGEEFMAFSHWHEILKMRFGDYMKLPPVEEQKSHTAYCHAYFWRDGVK